tara:strand:- start:3539 stop:3766 length:228 start_codon:yes stop_codon:yes gene_type:complete
MEFDLVAVVGKNVGGASLQRAFPQARATLVKIEHGVVAFRKEQSQAPIGCQVNIRVDRLGGAIGHRPCMGLAIDL